jgi:hypothetical protein
MEKLNKIENLSDEFFKYYKSMIAYNRKIYLKIIVILFISTAILYTTLLKGYDNVLITAISFALLVLTLFSYYMSRGVFKWVKIIPYYQKKLSTTSSEAFFRGQYLFWNSKYICELLKEKNLPTLYSFVESGWHYPNDAIPTVDYLISKLEDDERYKEVLKDLLVIKTSLERGKILDTPFHFIIRTGNGVSGLEFERCEGLYL